MRFLRLTFLLASISGLFIFSACNKGSDPKPTIEETQLKLLVGTTSNPITWKASKVTFDASSDRTAEFSNFTLSIDGIFNKDNPTGDDTFQFTTSGRPSSSNKSPWPASGTWKFEESSPATLIRRFTSDTQAPEPAPDGLLITYSVTADKLQLTFEYDGAGFTGRTNAIAGTWIFEFTPQ